MMRQVMKIIVVIKNDNDDDPCNDARKKIKGGRGYVRCRWSDKVGYVSSTLPYYGPTFLTPKQPSCALMTSYFAMNLNKGLFCTWAAGFLIFLFRFCTFWHRLTQPTKWKTKTLG